MKKTYSLIAVLMFCLVKAEAVSRDKVQSSSDFTGDNVSFHIITVSSAAAATALLPYSTSRGAGTILNVSTNTVYLSSSSAVTAGNTNTFPLPAGQSVEFRSNAAVFGQVAAGIGNMLIGVIREW